MPSSHSTTFMKAPFFIEQKGMTFDHDFLRRLFFSPFLLPPKKKGEEEKKNE